MIVFSKIKMFPSKIAKIWKILPQHEAEMLVHAFVTSRMDYYNSFLVRMST